MDKQTGGEKGGVGAEEGILEPIEFFFLPPFSMHLVAGDEKIISLLPFKQSIVMGV